jgi:hypothetical protein
MLGKLIDRSNGGCYFIAAKLLIHSASELPRANVEDTSTGTAWSRFAASRPEMMFLLRSFVLHRAERMEIVTRRHGRV